MCQTNPHLAAAWAIFEFEGKDATQQSGPTGRFAAVVVVVVGELFVDRPNRGAIAGEQFELTNDGRGRRFVGDDASAKAMMAGEEAEVANQGYARRRYQGGEASDEVDWFEKDGTRAIFPRTFEANADAAIVPEGESLEGQRGAAGVANEAFESL